MLINPTPEEIRAARQAAGLTQTQAGALLHTTVRTWQQWEAGDRKMHPAFWELFRLKTAAKPQQGEQSTHIAKMSPGEREQFSELVQMFRPDRA